MNQRFNTPDRTIILHYITINVRQQKQAFFRDECARGALQLLREHCDLHPAKLVAYVIMPTHMHAILNPRDGKVSRFLSHYKPAVTRLVSELAYRNHWKSVQDWLRVAGKREQLWQEGKHDFHLWSEKLIWQKINYIHNNPVRSRLVEYVDDYLYSSFHAWFASKMEAIVPVDRYFWWDDLPMIYDNPIG